jgi:cell wall-associated NlpC family hydrolase
MSRRDRRFAASAVAVGIGLAVISGHGAAATSGRAPGKAAAQAIAYARQQIGKPYLWGGTGPDAFDCSGLVQQAYAHAGVSIARTSQDQWATERHVSSPQPGDLAFFVGALQPGESSPGHVGIVIGHGKMIEAYGTGYPIRVASYDRPDLVGFTNPGGRR